MLTGSGQSVALVEFDGYFASDITAYETQFHEPAVPLTIVPIDGGVPNPTTDQGNGEVSLDIEMAIAMAPGLANIYVYEASTDDAWDDMLTQMASDNKAKQIGCSWGLFDPSEDPTADSAFQEMAVQGQTFFNACGDSDSWSCALADPVNRRIDKSHRRLPERLGPLIYQRNETCEQGSGATRATTGPVRAPFARVDPDTIRCQPHVGAVAHGGRSSVGGHADAFLPCRDGVEGADSAAAANTIRFGPIFNTPVPDRFRAPRTSGTVGGQGRPADLRDVGIIRGIAGKIDRGVLPLPPWIRRPFSAMCRPIFW